MIQKTIIRTSFTSLLALLASFAPVVAAETVVYTAKLIRTMEPALPQATAVAVEDGKGLGSGRSRQLSTANRLARCED